MVKIARFIAYTFFFIMALMYFFPKVSVYYFLEQQLKPYGIIISSEEIEDSGFGLSVTHATISAKSIESANIANIDTKVFGFYNSLNMSDISLSTAAASFVPLHVESASLKYTIFNPLNVVAHAYGEFGEADVSINILERSLHVDLIPSKMMLKDYRNTLRNLKKSDNGEFVYDKNF